MKRKSRMICILISWIWCFVCNAQTIEQPDTIIDMVYYKSYCIKSYTNSNLTLLPSYCIYKVYKPVNTVDRNGMQFKGTNNHFNYNKSGYDKGHLVPAEDMAWSKESLLSTFNYVNCVPQTSKLNRGKWRIEELKVHKLASTDSLLVIVGACNYDSKGVPMYCYKIVQQLSSSNIYFIIYNQDGKEKKVASKKFLTYFRKYLK